MRYDVRFISVHYRDEKNCFVTSDDILEPGDRTTEEFENELETLRQNGWECLDYSLQLPGSDHTCRREVCLRKPA